MNSSERWEKIKDIFESALSRTGGERRAFLEGACGGDGEMLREVESLLGSFDADYLEDAAVREVADAFVSKTAVELSPGVLVGQYRIVGELGKGGQGAVYKAVDTKLNRTVAIKTLPPELNIDETARRRFYREAQLASSLDHPNICAIHDLADLSDTHFIVMQFVDGKNVRELVNGKPLDLTSALRIGIQVCDALAAAHERGIIHRDIKAHNIIVTPSGTAKILDFGLAKLTHNTGEQTELTSLGSPYGTPTYAAPEQSRGEKVDHRADIFSTGVLMYEMLTGTWAFHGKTPIDVRHAVIHDQPRPIADRRKEPISARLDAAVMKALAKDPATRYQNIGEMRDELTECLRALPDSAEAASFFMNLRPFVPGHKRSISKGTLVFLSSAVFVILAVAGYFAVRAIRNSGSAPPTAQRKLTRLTFDPGLQSEPSWSPDGRLIAYYSDKSGNFDIWVQQLNGGEPVQVTRSPAHDWQPDFSPDGENIVFRSEREGGGLFVMPSLGGTERKISPTGYDPRWSPDGKKILFFNTNLNGAVSVPRAYIIDTDGKNPREVWPQASNEFVSFMRAAWYPDGKSVSIIGQRRFGDLGFWTVPVDAGTPRMSVLNPEVEEQIRTAGAAFYDFAWERSGAGLFLEGEANGVRNLWKVAVEPETLRWTGPFERLTTGAGKDTEVAVSPDGTKLAFTTRAERTRVWSFPFDAASGKQKGEGQPITSAGMDTGEFALSNDGKRLVFVAKRAGKLELWERSTADGKERLLLTAADNDVFTSPRWSPDDKFVAFARNHNPDPENRKFVQTFEKSIVLLPVEDGAEKPITTANVLQGWPWDWSEDGKIILGSSAIPTAEPEHWGLYLFPIEAAPLAETRQKLVIDDPQFNFWQGRFSPDGRWILFLAAGITDDTDSFLGVIMTAGGDVTRIASGTVDKPRWSPDGRTIYFYSNRSGFRNVWGIRFDPVTGRAGGEAFRATNFESPDRMLIGSPQIGHGSMITDLAIAPDRIIVNVTQITGSVWILENVDR